MNGIRALTCYLLGALLSAGCTTDEATDREYVEAYYVYFHPSGGLRTDSTYLFGPEELDRLDAVARYYGYRSARDSGGMKLAIPMKLARDTDYWANLVEKANNPDWLRDHLRFVKTPIPDQ